MKVSWLSRAEVLTTFSVFLSFFFFSSMLQKPFIYHLIDLHDFSKAVGFPDANLGFMYVVLRNALVTAAHDV